MTDSNLSDPRIRLDMSHGRPQECRPDRYVLELRTPKGRARFIELTEEKLLELVFQAMQARDLMKVRESNRRRS